MNAVGELYGRVPPTIRAIPLVLLVLLVPFAAEFAQHVVEIGLGMYAPDGFEVAAYMPRRMLFGLVKVLAVLVTTLFLTRWWANGRDVRRALRPGPLFWKGLAIMVAVEAVAGVALLAVTHRLLAAVGPGASRGLRLGVQFAPLLAWLFVATMLFPWFFGMLVEDRSITARRSFVAMRGRVWRTFGLLLVGIMPLMAVHYAFGYGAMGRPVALVWGMMLMDAGVVAVMAVVLGSTYFTIYRRAADRLHKESFIFAFRRHRA